MKKLTSEVSVSRIPKLVSKILATLAGDDLMTGSKGLPLTNE